jgi:hypothetical protein
MAHLFTNTEHAHREGELKTNNSRAQDGVGDDEGNHVLDPSRTTLNYDIADYLCQVQLESYTDMLKTITHYLEQEHSGINDAPPRLQNRFRAAVLWRSFLTQETPGAGVSDLGQLELELQKTEANYWRYEHCKQPNSRSEFKISVRLKQEVISLVREHEQIRKLLASLKAPGPTHDQQKRILDKDKKLLERMGMQPPVDIQAADSEVVAIRALRTEIESVVDYDQAIVTTGATLPLHSYQGLLKKLQKLLCSWTESVLTAPDLKARGYSVDRQRDCHPKFESPKAQRKVGRSERDTAETHGSSSEHSKNIRSNTRNKHRGGAQRKAETTKETSGMTGGGSHALRHNERISGPRKASATREPSNVAGRYRDANNGSSSEDTRGTSNVAGRNRDANNGSSSEDTWGWEVRKTAGTASQRRAKPVLTPRVSTKETLRDLRGSGRNREPNDASSSEDTWDGGLTGAAGTESRRRAKPVLATRGRTEETLGDCQGSGNNSGKLAGHDFSSLPPMKRKSEDLGEAHSSKGPTSGKRGKGTSLSHWLLLLRGDESSLPRKKKKNTKGLGKAGSSEKPTSGKRERRKGLQQFL